MRNSQAALILALTLGIAAVFVLTVSRRPEPASLLLVGAVLTAIAAIARRRMRRTRASSEVL
jgi:uncharacterized BrkB/YihY/UPF0761 family membrane protein